MFTSFHTAAVNECFLKRFSGIDPIVQCTVPIYVHILVGVWDFGGHDMIKEVIKEQPTSRNLSATATRVLQCTCPVAASRKDFSAFHTSPLLTPCPHT